MQSASSADGVSASTGTPQTCGTQASAECSALDLTYAPATKVTGTTPGDVTGQLRSLTYTADARTASVADENYTYNPDGRLNTASATETSGARPTSTSASGSPRSLALTAVWQFDYDTADHLIQQTKFATPVAMTQVDAGCKYASRFGWGDGHTTCWVDPVSYWGTYPRWWKTPKGKWVVGINYDQCALPAHAGKGPRGFESACDAHDYHLAVKKSGKLPAGIKKSAVDSVLYTTTKDYSCDHIGCSAVAWGFYKAARSKGRS